MAPRRGGGGGSSSGSSISSCPEAFTTTLEQVFFASDVVFFAVLLGIALALCSFRKKSGVGKKLIGILYILALFFFLLTYACSIVATVLLQCQTTDIYTYYNWRVAIVVFSYLGNWLLLVVVVFTLNIMLREQLGHSVAIFKTVLLVIVGIMGALTCALAGLNAYLNWQLTTIDQVYTYSPTFVLIAQRLELAYLILYLLSVLASGVLALMTIKSLRSGRNPAGDLIGWVIALTIAMVLWIVISIIFAAWNLQDWNYTWESSAALTYILDFAQALSFIFVLCIAKHAAWSKPTGADPIIGTDAYAGPVSQHQQYAHNADPNAQAYYYQQQPVYNGTMNSVRA